MNLKQIGLSLVLADFALLSGYAVYEHGVVGLFELATANVATTTVFVDLVIALSLALAWMWQDARRHGQAFWPFAFLTLGLGSIGPLLYLIRRVGDGQPALTAASVVPARQPSAALARS